jgi:hypothetical protein
VPDASRERKKLLRLASFLLFHVALQLFLELLVLYHLIGALPDFFYIGFRFVEIPSQPGGYFHVHQLLSVLADKVIWDNNVLAPIEFLFPST